MTQSTTKPRRGRPPKSGGALSSTERNRARRTRLHRVDVLLNDDEAAALAVLMADGATKRDAVGGAIVGEAKRKEK